MLTEAAISDLEVSLARALDIELPRLQQVQARCRQHFLVEEVPKVAGPLHPVATVATDGGENQLQLDPIRVHVLRIADSDGGRHFEGFIPVSLTPAEILEAYFAEAPLVRLLETELGIEFRDFLPENSYQRGNFLQLIREVLEWGAMLKLAATKTTPHLLIRDGLLRSVAVPERVWEPLRTRLGHYSELHGHRIVGVAKRSAVLNYLSLAVGMEQQLPFGQQGFVRVPKELEKEAAPPNYSWMQSRLLGQLYILRPSAHAQLFFACEIPAWQEASASEILGHLAVSGGAFPQPGYPLAIQEAHRHARIGEFEIAFMERLLLKSLTERNPHLSQEVALQQLMGRRLSLPVEGEHD